jgi:hypothetical protein
MSNVILIDGFDLYNGTGTNTGLGGRWLTNIGGMNTTVAGRFGGQAIRCNTSLGQGIQRLLPAAGTTFAFGIAFRMSFLPSGSPTQKGHIHFRGSNGTTIQCGIQFDTNGSLSAYRLASDTSGTVLGSSAGSLYTANTWNYLEAEVVISTTVGRITLFLNGAQVLNLTGVNTANAGVGTTADTFVLSSQNGGNAGFAIDYDDLYVTDSATKLGERRVETLHPTADTTQKDWTPSTGTTNFGTVDDTLADGTDYVQASTVGNLDLYDLSDLSTTPVAIDAVQISAWAMKSDANSRNIALVADLAGTQTQSPDFVLAGNFQKQDTILNQKPGGGNWDASTVAQLKVGPKVTL